MSLAFDRCNADQLARTDRDLSDPDHRPLGSVRSMPRVGRARAAGRFADHRGGERSGSELAHGPSQGDLTLPEYRHPVRRGEHLGKLVGDECRGAPPLHEVAHQPEQCVHLARCQQRAGLVEQEDFGSQRERLRDLETLTQRDAQSLDPVVGPKPGEKPTGPIEVSVESPADRQLEILADRQGLDAGEMLMHHPDPVRPGIARGAELHGLSPQPDRSRIRTQHPVSDVQQSGFPRAVLAQEGVHFTGKQGEIGGAQGRNGSEALGDPLEGEKRKRGLGQSPVGWSWNSQGRPNRSLRWAASAFTPIVSVA